MKILPFTFAACLSVAAAFSAASAQDATGFRADILGQLEYVQNQIIDLENAIPDEKMTWRPNKDVRSISEVFSHIAFSNYLIFKFAGVALPEGIAINSPEDEMKAEKASTDKKVIHEQLVKSFEFVKSSIRGMADASMENRIDFFGEKMTMRAILMIVQSHTHEHLGQSIAYARMVDVVPPWTAERQAAEKKAAEKQGAEKLKN
jgi:uncharacterized damage-inducible protein DinB